MHAVAGIPGELDGSQVEAVVGAGGDLDFGFVAGCDPAGPTSGERMVRLHQMPLWCLPMTAGTVMKERDRAETVRMSGGGWTRSMVSTTHPSTYEPLTGALTPNTSPPHLIASRDGLYSVDSRQRIRLWSESAAELLGVSAEQAIGRHCYDVLAGADASNARHCRLNCPAITNARRGRGTPDFDLKVSTLSGGRRIVNVSVLVLGNSEPTDTFTLHLFRDVTRRRHVDSVARSVSTRVQARGNPPEACLLKPLTPRQLEVLRLLAAGFKASEAAEAMGISQTTVRNHIHAAMKRLGAHTRLEALSAAAQVGLI